MRKVKLTILFIIIFLAGFLIANGIKYYLDMWKADRNVQAWQKGIDDIFANDTYGGATPEETFDMYLAALKKGDLELASRYFVINKQREELEELKKINIDEYITKLTGIKNTWEILQDKNFSGDNQISYKYIDNVENAVIDDSLGVNIKFEPGQYTKIVQFEKNNTLWKLYLL